MKGCEVRRDGIIILGAGANSNNTHSSRLSTSLFSPFSIQLTKKKHHTFFSHPQVLATERRLETTSKSMKWTQDKDIRRTTIKKDNVHEIVSYNVSVSAFMAFRNTANKDSCRCLPRFFHSCQTRVKSRHVGWAPCQLREAVQEVSRQIVALLIHVGHQGPLKQGSS